MPGVGLGAHPPRAASVLRMATVPTAAYSIGMRIVLDNVPGTLGRFAVAVGEAGGNIAGASGFEAKGPSVSRLIDVHARDEGRGLSRAARVG